MDSLTVSIIKTISYFDIFDHPLTSSEVYTELLSDTHYSYADVTHALKTSSIESRNGFYFLPGRRGIVSTRQNRYISNIYKMRKAKRAAQVFAYVPFVRMIAVCNNLAFFNSKKESDLDLFIIVSKNALPFVRLVTVFLSILFFKRPHVHSTEDAVCLSFFVDSTYIDLEDTQLFAEDIYLKYWIATLLPLYDFDGMQYSRFLEANELLLKALPHFVPRDARELRVTSVYRIKQFFEIIFSPFRKKYLAQFLYAIQIKRLPLTLKLKMNTSTSVMITESIFKTHVDDQRLIIKENWEKRIDAYIR